MHIPAVHYIRESTCSRAFKKSCRYSVKDSLTKLLLLLGEKKNQQAHPEDESQHLESHSGTKGGGKTWLKCQGFVSRLNFNNLDAST